MTDQSENSFSVEELQMAMAKSYGLTIGHLTTQGLLLEKQVNKLQFHRAEFERQNSQLIAGAVAYEKRIAELEAENARLRRGEFTANEIAAQGSVIANEARIKKAAPVDG
jgi:hypothetical protein